MSTMIPNADALVNYVLDFTGSSNQDEIKQCIYLTELMMRNIELPALRTDPWTTIGVADSNGFIPIPADMNRPILFYNQGNPGQGANTGYAGPWIVYDRIGDRDMITMQIIENLYLNPVNIPQVYRGKFSEVGQSYEFLPGLGAGALINMYYFKTWPLLFSDASNNLISATGTVGTIAGTGPYTAVISGMTTTVGLSVGSQIVAGDGVGSLGSGTCIVTLVNSTDIHVAITGGTAPQAGSVVNITAVNQKVENNVVLQSFPEGYVYGTLHNYYHKRKMADDANRWLAKFDLAWDTIEDQNNKGKWSGGHTKLTSVFQPRQMRRYALK